MRSVVIHCRGRYFLVPSWLNISVDYIQRLITQLSSGIYDYNSTYKNPRVCTLFNQSMLIHPKLQKWILWFLSRGWSDRCIQVMTMSKTSYTISGILIMIVLIIKSFEGTMYLIFNYLSKKILNNFLDWKTKTLH